MSGAKQKLTISRWDVPGEGKDSSIAMFTALLNPVGYTRTRNQTYAKVNHQKFDAVLPEGLTLDEMVFDGTGVVGVETGNPLSVDEQLTTLRTVLYEIKPNEPVKRPVVELLWGSLYFVGRATTMKVQYTLFKPNGLPLRARVTLAFIEYNKEYAKSSAATITDTTMTRQIQVTAGTSLPLLCFQAYKDPAMVQAVARANNLTTFRNLPNGQTLDLPPE